MGWGVTAPCRLWRPSPCIRGDSYGLEFSVLLDELSPLERGTAAKRQGSVPSRLDDLLDGFFAGDGTEDASWKREFQNLVDRLHVMNLNFL